MKLKTKNKVGGVIKENLGGEKDQAIEQTKDLVWVFNCN